MINTTSYTYHDYSFFCIFVFFLFYYFVAFCFLVIVQLINAIIGGAYTYTGKSTKKKNRHFFF